MYTKKLLHLGWITAIAFILVPFILASQLENYSPVSQTISEIGEKGSPLYIPWQIFSIGIGVLFTLFAIGVISFAKKKGLSVVPGIFMLAYGLSQFAIGIFPAPHPLHNVFGLSMALGYLSPLMFALIWKRKISILFRRLSLTFFILIMLGMFLNLTPAFAPSLYPLEYYGIIQRFLIFSFFIYCAFVSVSTIKSTEISQEPT